MSCRIDRCEHGERSMLVFISTVVSMENGRCEMTFSLFSPDFLTAFTRLFQSYYPIISILLPDYMPRFVLCYMHHASLLNVNSMFKKT